MSGTGSTTGTGFISRAGSTTGTGFISRAGSTSGTGSSGATAQKIAGLKRVFAKN